MTDPENTHDPDWPAVLGIVDIPTGLKRVSEGRDLILAAARSVMHPGEFTQMDMVLWGMVTRLQSFHEAAVSACEATNPHATYTLIRAYAEQCAALIYAIDHPDKAERLWRDPEGHGVPIGKMTSYADRNDRIGNFRLLYDQLSKYAHPSQLAHYAGMRVEDDRERAMSWQSPPRFKTDDEVLIAYGWIYELAEAGAELVVEFAMSHGLLPRSDLTQRAQRTAGD